MKKRLIDVHNGESARILGFQDEEMGVKLLEMGCFPGSSIHIVRSAPFGCPLYVKVGSHQLALRKQEAETILVA